MARIKISAHGENNAAPCRMEKKAKLREERQRKRAEKEKAAEAKVEADGDGEEKKGKKDKKDKDKKDKKAEKKSKAKPSEENDSSAAEIGTVDEEEKNDGREKQENLPNTSKKRKRSTLPDGELEIDINAPEPPSKKALRKLKKSKSTSTLTSVPTTATSAASTDKKSASASASTDSKAQQTHSEHASQSRSKWGIWIGNLTFSTTRQQLEDFLTRDGTHILRTHITRTNLPVNATTNRNKGFAYVDFSEPACVEHALQLSESLLGGRPVLIKSSADFSNRNASASAPSTNAGASGAGAGGARAGKNPPSKILFVGNLDFATTDDDLKAHFAFAGNIVRVRLATFEDSGKCKGFGFVDFADVESVARAISGLTEEEEAALSTTEGREEVELEKRRRRRKFWGSRMLSLQYGEDPATRYKKRFGKDRPRGEEDEGGEGGEVDEEPETEAVVKAREMAERVRGGARKKRDTRSNDPGAAFSSDIRRVGGITQSTGKKMTFDED